MLTPSNVVTSLALGQPPQQVVEVLLIIVFCICVTGIVAGPRWCGYLNYRQVSNIRQTWVGIEIVDHSDVVGASPVGAAPTTSSFST